MKGAQPQPADGGPPGVKEPEEGKQMTAISTVPAFLSEIESFGDAVYRGQANAEWSVDCSAARRGRPVAE